MTCLATPRRLDFVVADQAIGHWREGRFGDRFGLVKSFMTESATGFSGELHVELVIELDDQSLAGLFDRHRIVTIGCPQSVAP